MSHPLAGVAKEGMREALDAINSMALDARPSPELAAFAEDHQDMLTMVGFVIGRIAARGATDAMIREYVELQIKMLGALR